MIFTKVMTFSTQKTRLKDGEEAIVAKPFDTFLLPTIEIQPKGRPSTKKYFELDRKKIQFLLIFLFRKLLQLFIIMAEQ